MHLIREKMMPACPTAMSKDFDSTGKPGLFGGREPDDFIFGLTRSLCSLRKLQHRGKLANAKARQQDDFSARKLERIMMFVRAVKIDLSKTRNVLLQSPLLAEAERVIAFDVAVKA